VKKQGARGRRCKKATPVSEHLDKLDVTHVEKREAVYPVKLTECFTGGGSVAKKVK